MRTRLLHPPLAAAAVLTLLGACLGAGATGASSPAGQPPRSPSGSAEEQVSSTVTVYAAASLQAAFTDLIATFEQANPSITVEPVYDGSATLVTQLTEGADADVFAAADTTTMNGLVAAGLAAGNPEVFASNTLVIAVPAGNPLDVSDLADLQGLDYVVCAPEVPCGAATASLLEVSGLSLDAVSQEQNVTAVAERVARGEVDAGLVYATDVAARSDLLQAVVPSGADQVVNRYPITTLGAADEAAAAFAALVLSDQGRALLAEHGFGAP
jgi:molybdate transport system substrate-binding protein